ncbi:MAG: NTP transferase domain-containing protein [Actinomycetia bacterium]|nr:NTP transferase domain-containing protein [Actinomycetes bacterium]
MSAETTYDAIVLGGGDGSAIDPAQPIKGLIEIAGKPMIQWVVEALDDARSINEIVVVMPQAVSLGPWADGVKVIVHDGTLIENGEAGVAQVDGTRPIMGLCGDIPAITAQAIDDYTDRVNKRHVQFSYPLILESDIEREFPGSIRTYVKLREGKATGGNIVTGTVEVIEKLRPLMNDFYEMRKDPSKAIKLVGPQIATQYAMGRLSVAAVEERIFKQFGIRGAGIFTSFAAIGTDVDKPSDVSAMEKVLSNR